MNRRVNWWQLYLFTAVSLLILCLIPPADKGTQILWMLVTFIGIGLWLRINENRLSPPEVASSQEPFGQVSEFYDEDRLYLQYYRLPLEEESHKEVSKSGKTT